MTFIRRPYSTKSFGQVDSDICFTKLVNMLEGAFLYDKSAKIFVVEFRYVGKNYYSRWMLYISERLQKEIENQKLPYTVLGFNDYTLSIENNEREVIEEKPEGTYSDDEFLYWWIKAGKKLLEANEKN